MDIKLIRIETYGLKNIKRSIEIDFSSTTINKKVKPYPVKAIFGMNGAGKSALINSIELYKNLILKRDYIRNDWNAKDLYKLINKETKEFFFKIYFQVDNKNLLTFSHEINVKSNKEGFYIANEKMNQLLGQTINSNETLNIYEIKSGVLKCNKSLGTNDFILDKTLNLLFTTSLTSVLTSLPISEQVLKESKKHDEISNQEIMVSTLYLFDLANKIITYSDFTDYVHFKHYFILHGEKQYNTAYLDVNISSQDDLISIKNFKAYSANIKKLEEFIKIFKHDLKSIDITKKIDGNYYHCQKNFNYGNYIVESEFESSGIQKMIKLHSYINYAIQGKFVFIDELDASINGVFLDKLIDFFNEYGKGILCFTSHNLEPIRILKNKTKALMFMGETGKLVYWTRSGNANPANYYREGMIEDSPFNMDIYDFYNAFDVEE